MVHRLMTLAGVCSLLGLLAEPLLAQLPPTVAYPFPISSGLTPPARPVELQPPPPFYVRLDGPAGMELTFYRGSAKGQTIATPCTVALRPGFVYRLQATGGAARPGLTVYPTLEVRGSLVGGKVRVQDYPATLTITAEDLSSVARGALLTRVLALERPDTAVPVATRSETPLEFAATTADDPVQVASQRGTPMLIMRLGGREYTEKELVADGLSGTILLPGEKLLPVPKVAPILPWYCCNLYDPVLGPRDFSANYCLPDGGDTVPLTGIGPDGKLAGLNATDTAAHYLDSRGRRHVVASNRVCIYVPRFFTVRHELNTVNHLVRQRTGEADTILARDIYLNRYLAVTGRQQTHLQGVDSRMRPSSNLQITGPLAYGQVEGLDLLVALRGVKNLTVATLGPEETEPGDGPLVLFKWPDRFTALIGEILTFYLRYTNRGSRPIRGVVIADSLGPRFEYIPGSARSDRDGTFTTQTNEVGSVILRWDIGGELPPRETGLVSFQVRVR